MLALRAARVSEAAELTELCLRSKAVWGYDAAFMEACRDELAMTPEKIAASRVQVAELDGRLAGVARLIVGSDDAELAALFVEPAVQRAGVGRALFEWAVAECRALNVASMTVEADPGAAPFYRRMGARDVGTVPSGSIPGRVLPKLEFVLTGAA
jgi:GNAT superfamily N-acetyltransferase